MRKKTRKKRDQDSVGQRHRDQEREGTQKRSKSHQRPVGEKCLDPNPAATQTDKSVVLVCHDCWNKMPQKRWLDLQASTVSQFWSPGVGDQATRCFPLELWERLSGVISLVSTGLILHYMLLPCMCLYF